MTKCISIIILSLLCSCNTRTGNHSEYAIATHIDTLRDKRKIAGREVFQRKCSSCHQLVRENTGPALFRNGLENKDTTWLPALLTDHKHLKKDSAYKARVKRYGFSCPEQPISEEEVKSVSEYLRNPSHGCVVY